MSIPSPEKDSLLGQTVHEKIAHQILRKEVFLDNLLYCSDVVYVVLCVQLEMGGVSLAISFLGVETDSAEASRPWSRQG